MLLTFLLLLLLFSSCLSSILLCAFYKILHKGLRMRSISHKRTHRHTHTHQKTEKKKQLRACTLKWKEKNIIYAHGTTSSFTLNFSCSSNLLMQAHIHHILYADCYTSVYELNFFILVLLSFLLLFDFFYCINAVFREATTFFLNWEVVIIAYSQSSRYIMYLVYG